MERNQDVPLADAVQSEDAKPIKAIGFDFWWTLARIMRNNQFWTNAAIGGVVEPLLLIKSEMGLADTLTLNSGVVDEKLVHHWCTTHVHGTMKDYLENLADNLLASGIKCQVTPAAIQKLEEITDQERKDFHIFPDVPETLKTLKEQGYLLAVMPNASEFESVMYRRSKMFSQYIDHAFWSYELGLAKPDPRYFEAVLSKLGIKPEEFLFVDDQPANLIAARKLGIRVVRIEREGKVLSKKLASTVADIQVIKEVADLVEGLRLGKY